KPSPAQLSRRAEGDAPVAQPEAGAPAAPPAQAAAPPEPGRAGPQARAPPPAAAPPGRTAAHEAKDLHHSLSSQGAGLVKAELQGEKMREQRQLSVAQGYKLLFGGEVPDAQQMDMARPTDSFAPALAVGVYGSNVLSSWQNWTLDEGASSER